MYYINVKILKLNNNYNNLTTFKYMTAYYICKSYVCDIFSIYIHRINERIFTTKNWNTLYSYFIIEYKCYFFISAFWNIHQCIIKPYKILHYGYVVAARGFLFEGSSNRAHIPRKRKYRSYFSFISAVFSLSPVSPLMLNVVLSRSAASLPQRVPRVKKTPLLFFSVRSLTKQGSFKNPSDFRHAAAS